MEREYPVWPFKPVDDLRTALPWANPHINGFARNWYEANCCPYCGRVNSIGQPCKRIEDREECGLVTCWGMHDQGHFLLDGSICEARPKKRRRARHK